MYKWFLSFLDCHILLKNEKDCPYDFKNIDIDLTMVNGEEMDQYCLTRLSIWFLKTFFCIAIRELSA